MDKKNTLLLTVIAIATLLVAVVGATFAYFSAQTDNAAIANVDVKTSTVDTATMSTFNNLSINATQQNFDKDDASLTSSTEGFVSFTASNVTDREGNAEYCYTVELNIETNDFIYSLPKTKGVSNAHYPELVLNVWKLANQVGNSSGLSGIDTGDTNRYNKSMVIDTENHQLFYDDNILSDGYVCTGDFDYSTNKDSGASDKCTQINGDTNKLKGFDITVAGNSSYNKGDDLGLHEIQKIKIPKNDVSYGEQLKDADFIHKITATSEANPKTAYDLWKASVTLVNYKDKDINGETVGSGDQSKYQFNGDGSATPIGNTGKKFNAQLKFTPVNCENGTPLNAE